MSREIGYVSAIRYQRRVERFTADGTFTPPAGVSYAIAHIRGGGGGAGLRDRANPTTPAGAGGTSSVAFAAGTISATGGGALNANIQGSGVGIIDNCVAGAANSGGGAMSPSQYGDSTTGGSGGSFHALDGTYIVAGGTVTAGTGITITVGAGGTAGSGSGTVGAAGGSGYVWVEYEQPIGAGL